MKNMASVFLPVLLLSCVDAHAKRKHVAESNDTEICPVVTIRERRECYFGEGWSEGSEAEAVSAAERLTRAKLIRDHIEIRWDENDLRRQIAIQNVVQWKYNYDPESRTACAVAAINKTKVDQLAVESEQFDERLSAVLMGVKEQLDDFPVLVEAPLWRDGCSSGLLGSALVNELESVLVDVQLATQDDENAFHLISKLALGAGGGLKISFSLRPPWGGEVSIGGVNFAGDLFAVPENEQRCCRSDEDVGIEEGHHLGADKLEIHLQMPTHAGVLCPGERVELTILSNKAARVMLFELERDGDTYLAWPNDESPAGIIDSPMKIGRFDVEYLDDAGDLRLLAVAVPETGSFGDLEGSVGYCKLPAPLIASQIPVGAAWDSLTYRVLEPGHESCPDSGESGTSGVTWKIPICGLD